MYQPTNGFIFIDGRTLNRCRTETVLSVVDDQNLLYNMTLRENVILGEQVRAARTNTSMYMSVQMSARVSIPTHLRMSLRMSLCVSIQMSVPTSVHTLGRGRMELAAQHDTA